MMRFGKISDIDVEAPPSWQETVFMTVDLDWASDSVILFLLDYLESIDIPVTWFVTHSTPLIDRMRKNPKFELAVHPNFNHLLENNGSAIPAQTIISHCSQLIPEAVSIRSHSFTQSSRLLALFYEYGYKYDCNTFIPHDCNFIMGPFLHWTGLVRVPHCWEDDVWVWRGKTSRPQDVLRYKGIKVIDIHPIHFYLNSANREDLITARQATKSTTMLAQFVNRDYGSRNFIRDLIAITESS